ncbi:serine/threonine-protein phosphatase 2A regulatory subunit B'' subunit gamma-like [Crassostrea angulata]|uniref:Serine/threonine-protein phosphatase 2A regulatory subunit B'' subunit gamma n=1 Tax=Magallana gigas TaxID=29159 RepID=K1Q2S7_MAGGI|nr:serine/threonine-protein phosphatase 2A regulatory subunit B'' subunit gamma isoform X2 [Crassostrea gigas]XP_052698665.1 serine/threonine-protein phosphatase 2A regulatory subunit B'' subunit gamma-like [Crassostrea angulata]|eukprot:XP_011452511.1 PREDICTED: serine/threonine-protein phosphatase 2A regulatory subunit B'' subunit gamma isoform X2 [Crassostrea gigas]
MTLTALERKFEMELKKVLRKFVENHKKKKGSDLSIAKAEESALFTKYYSEWKGIDNTYKNEPALYVKLPSEDEPLMLKLREESRAVFLQRRSRELLDNDELQRLWFLLDQHHTPPIVGEDQMINYEDFLKVGEEAGPKCRQFFTASVFTKLLQMDPYGRISIMQFFNYVMRKVWLHQTRIGLSLYDVAGQGYLKESDLENYILELIPTLPQLNGLEKSFYSFYVCTAVRKFFFFLDPMRTGRIKIQDILACSFLDDLLELRDEDLSTEMQQSNWFSAPSALRVYGQYLNLDKDHNGMLSKEELARYGTGTLTQVFLDRVFQECLTYEGEMDYKTYLDFVLALENRREPQSLRYLFRILDVKHVGYLNVFSLNFFFRAIQEQMKIHGQEPVSFHDVKDEIFDMVKPKDPIHITLRDLINCGKGDTVVSILIDLNDFWTYENREYLVPESSEESDI